MVCLIEAAKVRRELSMVRVRVCVREERERERDNKGGGRAEERTCARASLFSAASVSERVAKVGSCGGFGSTAVAIPSAPCIPPARTAAVASGRFMASPARN
jgi:hypothetical protein